jgi:hypothetical protein
MAALMKLEGNCVECGKAYTLKNKNQLTCTTHCNLLRNRRLQAECRKAAEVPKTVETATCALDGCNVTFPMDGPARMAKKKYCSKACGKKGWK